MNDASVASGAGIWFTDEKLEQIKKAQSDPTMQKMFKNSNNRWEVWDNMPLLPLGNTDWLKEQFGTSFSQEHTLSINGGDDRLQYYVSGNYLNRGGLLRHGDDSMQRYTMTGKINAQITKWLRMTYNTRFSRQDFDSPGDLINGTDVFFHNMCRYWPILQLPILMVTGCQSLISDVFRMVAVPRTRQTVSHSSFLLLQHL